MKRQNAEPDVSVTETKRYAGYGATFGTDPDEVFIELRSGSPAYIRLAVGDYLQEGDAFHRERLGENAAAVDTWTVTEITPATVEGRHVDSGEVRDWPREDVEKKLAVGTYSTNLTDFERVSVYQVGRHDDYDPDHDGSGLRYRGRPYVSVVAYGDNGLKYGRRYRFAAPGSNEVFIWKQDEPAGGFSEDVEARLDRRVRAALEAEGYQVVDPAGC